MDTQSIAIRYKGTERFHPASLIHTWRYDDAEILRGPIVGASGEKDYLVNRVIHVFSVSPMVFSVTMLTLNATPLLILKLRDGRYMDLSKPDAREVEVRKVEAAIAAEAAA